MDSLLNFDDSLRDGTAFVFTCYGRCQIAVAPEAFHGSEQEVKDQGEIGRHC